MASPVFARHHHQPHHAHQQGASGEISIALTPIQLSAIIHGGSVHPHEMMMNRFWGGAMVIGGALELAGGVTLLLMPEPTTLSKIGGSVLSAHGADTMQAGVRQLYSGDATKTLLQQGGEFIAYQFGADQKTAERTGVVVEVAVPLVVSSALAAERIIAIRAGRIVLAEHEAAGGHTLLKHVGKTEAELRARLLRERVPAASSFSSLRDAESAITEAVKANGPRIRQWATTSSDRLELFHTASKDIGYGVVRTTGQLQKMRNIVVVFKTTKRGGHLYFILTAYPKP